MPRKKGYKKNQNGCSEIRNKIAEKLFGRPYGWLDAFEAQEVADYIKYKMK